MFKLKKSRDAKKTQLFLFHTLTPTTQKSHSKKWLWQPIGAGGSNNMDSIPL